MVSPELQIFKCFGCGEGGDAFSFLEKYEGMEFGEALKYLADRAGVKLQRVDLGAGSEKEKLIEINTQALRFYNYLLLSHPIGQKALDYLLKERGLKKQTIEEFSLGYSPENPATFKKFLVDKKKFNPGDIAKGGLGLIRGSQIYDRFSGRIVFPLFDHRGNPVGFSGRVLPWDKRETGKYINSPETPLYHKSNVLFALNLTRPFIKKKKVAIVVEGELDAILSYQAGIRNIVAIKGSALTEEQVRLLSRFAPKFILALDADIAGDSAARRGITVAGNLGVEVKVATITKYKDPDEAARGDLESYKKDLINAKGVWDYLIDSVFARYDSATGSGKAKISKELTPILSEIGDKIVQAHYANVLARKLDVPLSAVSEEIGKVEAKEEAPKVAVPQKSEEKGRRDLLEERLLTLAFAFDPKILLGKEASSLITIPLYTKLLAEYVRFFSQKGTFTVSGFAASLPGELFEGFAKMILDSGQNEKELDLVKKELKILTLKDNLKLLAREMRNLEESGEKDKLLKAQNKFNNLAKTLSGLDENGGGGIIFNE